jgi:hypothetical protein
MSESVMCGLLRIQWVSEQFSQPRNELSMYVKDEELPTGMLNIIAGSLEFLYGYLRILWEKYDIPVVVSHSECLNFALRPI